MRVAIIGAGIAGLACAGALKQGGHRVVLFDKGKRPGGRMSTRRAETTDGAFQFDHGAQYFTARDPAFAAEVARWETAGTAASWPAGGSDVLVGTPTMDAPLAAMAKAFDVRSGVRVEALARSDAGWIVSASDRDEQFDAAVVAVPAEQAAPLLAPHDAAMAATASETPSRPCWTVMAAFSEPTGIQTETFRGAGVVGWAARDSGKPGRGARETWVIQASPEWSAEHIEDAGEDVAAALLAAFAQLAGSALPPRFLVKAHRWRYARSGAAEAEALWRADIGLGACGDWLIGPRVESAWLSGRRLADRILEGSR